MLLADLVATSRRVADTSSRNAKIGLLATLLKQAAPDDVPIVLAFLTGTVRQSKLGVGYSTLHEARTEHGAASPSLTLSDVDAALERIAGVTGKGSGQAKQQRLQALLAQATREEQDFLFRLIIGEVRQGALAGLMIDAVAKAAGLDADAVRRASMLAGDPGAVARAALTEGAAGLVRFQITLFQPLQPMLAQSADDVGDALTQLGRAALEVKLDGARVQVHRDGARVQVFSRLGNDVTAAVPEVVDAARSLPLTQAILDGEAIALRPDGRPQPFQMTMRRFGRRLDVERLKAELPLTPFFFDLLYADGTALIDQPYEQRFEALARAVPESARPRRIVTGDVVEARAFFDATIAAGQEGLMAKALDAPYEAGARGAAWLKVKPAVTLDLVVLAAEWGHGRRQGKLSNLHLGARDPATGGFVMLGKTFKGMTDVMLQWQTTKLLELALTKEQYLVTVRPELVVEVAFNGIQQSSHYPGGLALRFARIVRYREDKRAEDADTITTVRELHDRERGA